VANLSLIEPSPSLPSLNLAASALAQPRHGHADEHKADASPNDGVFAGCIFAIDGISNAAASQLKRAIVAEGGVVSFGLSEHVDGVLVAKAPEPNQRLSFKLKQALRLNVPLLLASYVRDCLESNALRDKQAYTCRRLE